MRAILPICIVAALALALATASVAGSGLDRRFVAPCGHDGSFAFSPPATPVIASAALPFRLTLRFEDEATGAPLAVRVGVFDEAGAAVIPDDPEGALFQAVMAKSYFYADAWVEIGAPAGVVTVRAGHGFEYEPAETTLTVVGDMELVLGLRRIVDMGALGWFSGDTHIHVGHPPVNYTVDDAQTSLAVRAEHLGFANVLELEDRFTGALHPLSDSEHLIYFSMEHRNAHFAHLSIVGMTEWIADQGCATVYEYCGRTLDQQIYDEAHAQGDDVLIIVTHPFSTMSLSDVSPWPGGGVWRGMPIDLMDGAVDAVDLLCYTNTPMPEGAAHYTHMLNAGFQISPSVGTDANLASGTSYPPGGYRVYVRTAGGQLDFSEWVQGLRSGRCFVTNHPLITEFTVGNAGMGETCIHTNATVKADLSVISAVGVELVELVGDGRVLATFEPPGDGRDFSWRVSFDPDGLSWVVARMSGGGNPWHLIPAGGVFAQTAPVWVRPSVGLPATSDPGQGQDPPRRAAAATYFKEFTVAVENLFSAGGTFPDETARADFDTAVTRAAAFYEQLYADPPDAFALTSPMEPVWALGRPAVWTTTPVLRWETATDPEGDAVTYMLLIDTDATFSAPELFDNIPGTVFQVPEAVSLQDGMIYHWKVIARDPFGNQRESDPSDFIVVLTSTPAAAPAAAWALDTPWPNPFYPDVALRYSVPRDGGHVRLTVFDAAGRVVRRLVDRHRPAGVAEALWDGRDGSGARAPSGVYFFRLETPGGEALVRRAVLLK